MSLSIITDTFFLSREEGVLFMGEALITRSGGTFSSGGGISETKGLPSWVFTNSINWTPPYNGNYKIICIGAGGGNGAQSGYGWSDSYCGGGAGGIGILYTTLNTSSYPITVNGTASFGNLITATAGTMATSGNRNASSVPGRGGSASGTNVIAYNGGNGSSRKGGSVGIIIDGKMSMGGMGTSSNVESADCAGGCGTCGGDGGTTGYYIFPTGDWRNGAIPIGTKSPGLGGGTTQLEMLSACGGGGGGFGGGGGGCSLTNMSGAIFTGWGGKGGSAGIIVTYLD